jgi:hypothetical protein
MLRPRAQHADTGISGMDRMRGRPGSSKLSQVHRLVVSPSATQQIISDDNSNIEWASVRFVDILADILPTCSICLDEVVVPQMLQCGHCFCLSCILLHLSSTCNCCVCSEYARPSDLRTVRIQFISPISTGSNRSFQLVGTDGFLTLPLGSDFNQVPNQSSLGWWFSRVALATEVEIRRTYLSELERLSALSAASAGNEDIHSVGIIQAIEFVSNRLSCLPEPSVASPSNRLPDPFDGLVPTNIDDLTQLPRGHFQSGQVYCYRSIDGQHVYLEPIWLRVLLQHFTGEPDAFEKIDYLPSSLNLPIIFISSFVVDMDLKRRFRHLAHLSMGTPVAFCDVDLRGIVSPESLEALSGAVTRRIQAIKKAKTQRKMDKRDVARAQAVPLSEEWGLSVHNFTGTPPQVPTPEDFVPLTDHAMPDRPESNAFARIAAGLAHSPGEFREPSPRRAEDPLLAQYTRRSEGRSGEISRALDSAPRSKKGVVKFRLAG